MIPKNPHDFYINNRIVYKYVVAGKSDGSRAYHQFPKGHSSREPERQLSSIHTQDLSETARTHDSLRAHTAETTKHYELLPSRYPLRPSFRIVPSVSQ